MIPIKQSLTHDQAVGEAELKENEKSNDLLRLEKVLEKLYESHSELSASLEKYHRNQKEMEDFVHSGDSHSGSNRLRSVPAK